MTFDEADRTYQQLLRQRQAGQIDQQGYLQALDKLQIQAADGFWWRINPKDGSWLRWDGVSWVVAVPPHRAGPAIVAGAPAVPAPPESAPPASAPAAAKKGRRWWLACSVILLLSVCCLALVGGGGYLAVQAGSMSALQLSSQLSGAADVKVVNLDDNALTVRLNQLDVQAENAAFDSERLDPFDIGGLASLGPGRYQIDFESDGNALLTLTCTIAAKNGDTYRFVAVPEGMAITREGYDAQGSDEVDASTSSLCRQ